VAYELEVWEEQLQAIVGDQDALVEFVLLGRQWIQGLGALPENGPLDLRILNVFRSALELLATLVDADHRDLLD
jgi:hypothetical protein